jgi:phosphoglycerol transferase
MATVIARVKETALPSRTGSRRLPNALRTTVEYGGAALACILILTLVLRLWRADLTVPLAYSSDTLMALGWIKGILDHGWYLHNPSLGAPFELDMADFPLADGLHFLVLKFLALFASGPGTVFNLAYLLTFPLTTLTALFVLRRFGASYPFALAGGLLYAFLPHHFYRLPHLFLASYYLLPLMVWVLVRICRGDLPLLRISRNGQRQWHLTSRWSLAATLVAILMGAAGVYFAFFGCFFLLVAGTAASVTVRRLVPLGAAMLLVLVISLTTLAVLTPSLLSVLKNGPNPEAVRRSPADADSYGLRVGQLLLPIAGHRIGLFDKIAANYRFHFAHFAGGNGTTPLGMIGAIGFLGLLGRLLFFRGNGGRVEDSLAVLNGSAVLLGSVGGLGAFFTFLGLRWIRCYDRIGIYVGFFALAGLLLSLERYLRSRARPERREALIGIIAVVLVVFGIWDQTTRGNVPPYAALKQVYEQDRAFVKRIEAVLPPGSQVYQFPYVPYPEAGFVHHLFDYDLLRPYLHSHHLRWSYGGMKGRDGDRWHRWLAAKPLEEILEVLALTDFAGVTVDRAGYPDGGQALEADLACLLQVEPVVSDNGRFVFFSMNAFVSSLRAACTESEWTKRQERARYPVTVSWDAGFHEMEGAGEQSWRWCGREGRLILANLRSVPVTITLSMTLRGHSEQAGRLRLTGDLLTDEVPIGPTDRLWQRRLTLPPGRHAVWFTCDGPRIESPGDPRELVFAVQDFVCREE